MIFRLIFLFVIGLNIQLSVQHGYLYEPPSRASAWLNDTDFTACCKNYDYNQMYCGGFSVQWNKNGGRCGICGDAYDQEEPRTYEKGGAKYLGKIVRTYSKGAEIPVVAQLTANHLGFFEFRICKVDGWATDATHKCLNRTILTIKESNSLRYKVNANVQTARLTLKLPSDLYCKHCVLQWKYVTGNSWGIDPVTNQGCVGCGPVQENFIGCSDIAINGDGSEVDVTTTTVPTTETTTENIEISTTTEQIEPETTVYIEPTTTETDYETETEEIIEPTTEMVTEETTAEVVTEETTTEMTTESSTTPITFETTTNVPESTADYLTNFPIVTDGVTEELSTSTATSSTTRSSECKVKYEFGTKLNITRIVSIYCNRMCNIKCKVIMAEFERSIRRLVDLDIVACLETCPALCDCP